MATAVATLTVYVHPNGVDNTQRRTVYNGTCGLSASGTYVTNGIPTPWITMQSASGGAITPAFGPQTTQPIIAWFQSNIGGALTYGWDSVHNTLRIFSAGVELTNGAAIATDTIGFEAEFARGY